MGRPLRVLVVEDNQDDVVLLQHALHRGGYEITCAVVETPAAMRAALESQAWDVITSDHGMPRFSAPAALALAKEIRPDVPFIIISGEIDLNLAVSLMRNGAQNYIQKRELAQVVPAIERELRDAELRRERQQVDKALIESQENYHRLFDHAPLGIFQSTPEGKPISINPAFANMFGYDSPEDAMHSIQNAGIDLFADPNRRAEIIRLIVENPDLRTFENEYRRKDGSTFVGNLNGIIEDITVRKRSEEQIEILNSNLNRLAHMDEMTGIHNRRSLLLLAEHEFNVAMRYRPPLSILFFDIDFFKQINDTYGHLIGDQALKQIVQIACAEIRSADVIGRYGGDEFIVILPQTNAAEALPLAERIRTQIAAMRMEPEKGQPSLTISIGIAQTFPILPDSGDIPQASSDTMENLIKRADQALYAAKQAGRNQTMIYDPDKVGTR
jgi:diguanylate cyclase (GGDEF)-like protein/PAS domain S-box-containing protein